MTYKQSRIGDYFDFKKGIGYLGKYLAPSKVALIGLNSFEGGGGYKHGGEKRYSGPYKKDQIAKPGDLFISTTDITQDGRVLASAFLLPNLNSEFDEVIFSGDIVKAVPTSDALLPEFLFNVLRVKRYRNKAALASTGSTVRRIPVEVIADLEVPTPSLEIQRAINLMISRIDEKISLNQQMTRTLDSMTQTIFRSWFIDFDPVKAKVLGEQPEGMDVETSTLFPDSWEESDLGQIPKGWLAGTLGDFFSLTMGQSPSGKFFNFVGSGLPFYQGRTDFGERFPTRRVFSSAGNRTAEPGDTLVSVRAPVGDSNQATEKCVIGRGVAALRHKSGSEVYTHNLISTLRRTFDFYNGEGSVFGSINRQDFESIQIVEPSSAVLAKFESVAGPLNAKIRHLFDETQILIVLRDSLLSRLITGDLKLPDEFLEG